MLLAALAIAVAAGCGGSNGRLSKHEYGAKVDAAGKKFAGITADLQKARSLQDLARGLESGEKTLRKVADEFDSLKPPKNAEHANRQLVAGLRKSVDELEPLRRAAAAGNAKAVIAKARELTSSPATAQVVSAYRELQSKGYNLKPIGSG